MVSTDIAAILRGKVKFHVRDISNSDIEIDQIVLQVIEDIANETKIFRKIYGFTVDKSINVYDFNALSFLNNRLEVQSITIGSVTSDSVLSYMQTYDTFPSPTVSTTTFANTKNVPLELMDVYDENGYSIINKFHYSGTSERICNDAKWLEDNHAIDKAFVMSVVPDIQELRSEELSVITACIIEGCKYYFSNTYESTPDGQITNLYYQRYWQKKQLLINQFPTKIFAHIRNKEGARKWL